MPYPNRKQIAAGIRANCLNGAGAITQPLTPVEKNLHFPYLGRSIPQADKDYMAICMNAARDRDIIIWIDVNHVLVGFTKKLINDRYSPDRRPDLTDGQRVFSIRKRRQELYTQLKDAPLAQREDMWIDWLAKNWKVDKDELKRRADRIRMGLSQLPSEFTDQLGLAAGKVHVREIQELLEPNNNASQEERDLLGAIRRHYDHQLIGCLHPVCCVDLMKGLALRKFGGLCLDTDMLPAINPQLLEDVKSHPNYKKYVDEKLDAEMIVQKHLLANHRNWLYPNQNPSLPNTRDPDMDWVDQLFVKNNITNLDTLFQPIGDILAAPDLFLVRQVTWGLINNVIAAHKDSPALLMVAAQQALNLDYANAFNRAFNVEHSKQGSLAQAPAALIDARSAFLIGSYRKQNVLPLFYAGAASPVDVHSLTYYKAIASFPFDGLAPDCDGTIHLTGPTTFAMSMFHVVGRPLPRKELAAAIGLTGKFCEATLLDAQSTWMFRSSGQQTAPLKRKDPPTRASATQKKSKWSSFSGAKKNEGPRAGSDFIRKQLAVASGIAESDLSLWAPQHDFTGTLLHMDNQRMYLQPTEEQGFAPETIFGINLSEYRGTAGRQIGEELLVLVDDREVRHTYNQASKDVDAKVASLFDATDIDAAVNELFQAADKKQNMENLDVEVQKLVYKLYGAKAYTPVKAGVDKHAKDNFYGVYLCTRGDTAYFKLEGSQKTPILIQMDSRQVGKNKFVENVKYLVEILPSQQEARFTIQDRAIHPPHHPGGGHHH